MRFNKYFLIIFLASILGGGLASAKSYKRGVSENRFQFHAQFDVLEPGVTWYYNWGNTEGAYITDQECLEFAPMCWNGGFNANNIRAYVQSHPQTKYILGFNEPNFTSQANMTPQQAAERWPELQALAKELDLKIVAPALNYSPNPPYQNPTAWMDEFVKLVGIDAFDFVALHNYGGFGVMQDLCTTFHNRYGKPVWVTEFCYWPGESGSVAVPTQIASMVECVEWLEKTDWIYRYAWFKATEASAANYHLIESGKGEEPRKLTEPGLVYVYMSDFDPDIYHEINTEFPAVDYINRSKAALGKGNNESCGKPIEIAAFSSGATLDYQFDIVEEGDYTLTLKVTGVGEPTRFDPAVSVAAVEADGTEKKLADTKNFTLPGNETDYIDISFPLTLKSGKQTIRIKDDNPYMPSGIRISTVRVSNSAAVEGFTSEAEPHTVDVYNLQGVCVRANVNAENAEAGLPAGIYLIGKKKIIIK